MPDGLIYDVLIPMVVDMANSKIKTTGDIDGLEISSISEGGRIVGFKASETITLKAMVDSRILFYTDQLNKYRRII